MKLAIVGSKAFNDYELLVKFIKENYNVDDITYIVSGGEKCTNILVEHFVNEYNKSNLIFDEDSYLKVFKEQNEFIRKKDIIYNCDECVYFLDEELHKDEDYINLCKQFNKPCKICYIKNS